MEKNMENEMETGTLRGIIRIGVSQNMQTKIRPYCGCLFAAKVREFKVPATGTRTQRTLDTCVSCSGSASERIGSKNNNCRQRQRHVRTRRNFENCKPCGLKAVGPQDAGYQVLSHASWFVPDNLQKKRERRSLLDRAKADECS